MITPAVIFVPPAPAPAVVGTAEVLRRLGLSANRLEKVLRAQPAFAPPIEAGRRMWTDAHVAALRVELARRDALTWKPNPTNANPPETSACCRT